jgi:protochlorophyllide reductase
MLFSAFSKPAAKSSKKLVVITGTTSGLGKETARSLINQGDYYVVCACRDVEKMKQVAEAEGIDNSLPFFNSLLR